jgi:hypothetical protein
MYLANEYGDYRNAVSETHLSIMGNRVDDEGAT